jgi:hypothetical protein
VITARNIHNFTYQPGFLEKSMKDFYAVLKPGGVLGVEEHRADPRAEVAGITDGYMSQARVIAAAEKAGFKLAAKSEINANPKDTKDHPFGVWTLPPTRSRRRTARANPELRPHQVRRDRRKRPHDPAFREAQVNEAGRAPTQTDILWSRAVYTRSGRSEGRLIQERC